MPVSMRSRGLCDMDQAWAGHRGLAHDASSTLNYVLLKMHLGAGNVP